MLDVDTVPTTKLFTLFRRFFFYLRPHAKHIALNGLVIVGITVASTALIWMIGQGFDLLHTGRFDALPEYILVSALLVVILQGLRYANFYFSEWMEQRVIYAIRREMYAHLLALSTPFKHRYSAGELLTRLSQDISHVSQLLVLAPANLFSYSLTFVMYLSVLFYIDYRLTLVALLFVPLFLLHQRYFSKRTRSSGRAFLDCQGRMIGFEEESLANVQGIASFNAEPLMLKRFDHLFGEFRRTAMRNLLLNDGFGVSFDLIAALCAIVLVSLGVSAIQAGELSIGGLVNFLLYLGYLALPLEGLTNIPVQSQIRAAAAERAAEILDAVPVVTDRPGARQLADVRGHLQFNDVDFSYESDQPVLRKFTLDIRAGEFVALVGPSGAGKSTIARLLLRFYAPTHGTIRLDGVDLSDIALASLRAHIAIVWQEPLLLDDTVRANLLLANPAATDAQIINAAKQAQAHAFILELPAGYDTPLGPGGDRLSSGQKQRIAIAQAFLRQAPILILDEATSALDAQSELALQQALTALRRHCTVIAIAHRYATIAGADRIVYLNGDGSADIGTHAELLSRHAPYREAAAHQSRTALTP